MLVKIKQMYVLSNGSVTFSYGIKPTNNQYLIYDKDNINSILTRKNVVIKIASDISKKYKNKYLK
jgi:hypothetical protein